MDQESEGHAQVMEEPAGGEQDMGEEHVSGAGGFIQPSLPSPPYAPSDQVTCDVTLQFQRPLSVPRPTPLRPSSKAATRLRSYMDNNLREISGKYARKYMAGGYYDLKSVAADLEILVDLIWVSSTPYFQIPYLLQIANTFNDYMAYFPLDLKTTFTFLDLLDRCFYTLITGTALPENSPLPPHMAVKQLNQTEKVRLKSIVERTRLHCVKNMEDGPTHAQYSEAEVGNMTPAPEHDLEHDNPEGETPAEPNNGNGSVNANYILNEDDEDEDESHVWVLAVTRVYERSLVELSEQLSAL